MGIEKVYVTGMHSGQSPCSGLGIARSIKKAFPDVTVVGVAHWQGSSGFHDDAVDEALVLPIWSQIDSEMLGADIETILKEGSLWLPALDLEIHWTAENVAAHPGLLSPSQTALAATGKPEVKAVEALGLAVPDYISAATSDSDIHHFLRHHSWRCWLKSTFHDARPITSWSAFERAREAQTKHWKTDKVFLQRHVLGREETIAFSAYRGELLGAVHVDKCLLTPEGKTWAGKVGPLDPKTLEALEETVKRLEWSGGGEIEFIRDPDGGKWVIEWNPRFPAWIFGSAIAGVNLPGRLIGRALGRSFQERKSAYPFFTRVVHEIPAKEEIGMPLLPDATFVKWSSDGKKTGGGPVAPLPTLKGALLDDDDGAKYFASAKEEKPSPLLVEEIAKIADSFTGNSPARISLDAWTKAKFDEIEKQLLSESAHGPQIHIGYSVKTSPTATHLREARERGFFAECISQMEVRASLAAGFDPSRVILNGPGKFWPLTQSHVSGLHMLFCDSVEEFARVNELRAIASCVGFRIRLPTLESRFGHSFEDVEGFRSINAAVKTLRRGIDLGFHFHMPSWSIGVERWMDAFEALLLWCRSLQELSGRPVRHLDLGGGFYPGDVESLDVDSIRSSVASKLPDVEDLYFELGRSLTQQSEALVSRVLDVRRNPKSGKLTEIVVDASIAELPLARAYPHRVFFKSKKRHLPKTPCHLLRKGPARILGRICMEDDILCQQIQLPEDVAIGDLVVFGDAGAYERSMSYDFGRG